MITIKNNQKTISIDRTQLMRYAQMLLDACGYTDFDLGILITNDRRMQQYNREFRHIDKTTDVLSFPYHQQATPDTKIIARTPEEHNLGDIIISAPYVAHAAHELNVPFKHHLQRMLIHGLCHLMGYTHETERDYQLMDTKEQKLIKFLPHNHA